MSGRRRILGLTVGGLGLIGLSLGVSGHKLLVWNATASAPIGLYLVTAADELRVGDLVVVNPPSDLARLFADRSYLPAGVPLLKRIVATEGATICRIGTQVTVDGKPMAEALTSDSRQRGLPVWSGCRTLTPDEVFVLMTSVPASLDGRYFGPTKRTAILGRATPLWTGDAP